MPLRLITADDAQADATGETASTEVLVLPNDADPRTVPLDGVKRIDLHFPAFTDGRAHSQAFLLRRRLGFQGEIRATGDVLADQLPLIARNGFSQAVLKEGQDLATAQRQLARFPSYYQGDAVLTQPRFARETA
jgi:uncharacterized protein (DUF934 family)